ncbi:MAG: MarR family transcriptional regulator [Deltaproteobacteria bacterium]|nr:MarR family transcriptional regulator [Deltaproteobacteria bacterium]
MAAEPVLDLDRQLCFALYRAQRALTRAYAPLLEPLGLTYPQYLVFLRLWAEDGQRVNDLGDCLSLDSGTLTPLLKRLEHRGLVERRRDTADERVVRIYLTDAGRALRTKAKKVPVALAGLAGFDLDKPKGVNALAGLRDELTALATRLEHASDAKPR